MTAPVESLLCLERKKSYVYLDFSLVVEVRAKYTPVIGIVPPMSETCRKFRSSVLYSSTARVVPTPVDSWDIVNRKRRPEAARCCYTIDPDYAAPMRVRPKREAVSLAVLVLNAGLIKWDPLTSVLEVHSFHVSKAEGNVQCASGTWAP